jgi:4-diphosphocytidyl-2-C-methyl-D-erythritol kinase
LRQAEPRLVFGAVALDKRLPVAAGIGGGSADAAAVLRAVRRANPELADKVDWVGVATRLGADVAVCLGDRAAWVSGIGDRIEPLGGPLPALHAVLVNPLARVPADKTAQVYGALNAPALATGVGPSRPPERSFETRAHLVALMGEHGNDLETAARRVVPEIEGVMAALDALAGVEIARLSGAGPTCFAVFTSAEAARAAAATLAVRQSAWWIRSATLE